MLTEKSLYELGLEYREQAELIDSQIKHKRLCLASLPPSSTAAYDIKRSISVLSRQRREIRDTADMLCKYYEKENTKWVKESLPLS